MFLLGALDHLVRDRGLVAGDQLIDVEARVEDVEVGLGREVGHRRAVGADARRHDRVAVGIGVAAVASRHLEARRQALDVPLERPGQGLVEVVDVEHQLALGAREDAEVREVGVTAELDAQVGRGRRREVVGHDQRRAAVEGERRHEHPPVADGHEFGNTARGLALEKGDGVRPSGPGREVRMCRARHLAAHRLTVCGALLRHQVLDRRPRRDAPVAAGGRRHLGVPLGSLEAAAGSTSPPTGRRRARTGREPRDRGRHVASGSRRGGRPRRCSIARPAGMPAGAWPVGMRGAPGETPRAEPHRSGRGPTPTRAFPNAVPSTRHPPLSWGDATASRSSLRRPRSMGSRRCALLGAPALSTPGR